MRRLFAIVLPVALLVPAYPTLSLWWFHVREPVFLAPLALEGPLKIRHDPYGSGEFGARRSGRRQHRGVDWVASIGTPVLAAKSGVARIGRLKNGLGRYVEVHHPDKSITRYAHLKTIGIGDRQRVRRGDPLGTVGKSGNAKRRLIQPHLHFEVLTSEGQPVDPMTVVEQLDEKP